MPTNHLEMPKPGPAIVAEARTYRVRELWGEARPVDGGVERLPRSMVARAEIPNPDRVPGPGTLIARVVNGVPVATAFTLFVVPVAHQVRGRRAASPAVAAVRRSEGGTR